MSVLFEVTSGDITAKLEAGTREGNVEQFIADAFARIGTKVEVRGLTYTITRILKFSI